ncbi:MAG: sugar ABC transporter permease, partial [Microbacterium sp.]
MSSSRTLAESVPPVPDLPERRNTEGAARLARLWERNQTLIPTLTALVLLFGMLIYAEVAYGRV